jgi:hypothetical protein
MADETKQFAGEVVEEKLTQEELAKARAWVAEKCPQLLAKSHGCPICGGVEWRIDTRFGALPSYSSRIMERVWPLFLLTCANCAYMIGFNAYVSGVKQRATSPEVKPQAQEEKNG